MITLMKLAGIYHPDQVTDTTVSREALKCIANAIFLNEEAKAYLEQEKGLYALQSLLQSKQLSLETQFLTCRILFFMTVNRHDLVQQLIDADIASSIEKVLSDNVSSLEDPDKRNKLDKNTVINPWTVTSEALKLLFNLLLVESRQSDTPDATDTFRQCLVPVFHLLFAVPYPEPQPLAPPHSQGIHALMQFPFETIAVVWRAQKEWTKTLYNTVEEGAEFVVNILVNVLDRAIHVLIPNGDPDHTDHEQQADAAIAPVLLVLATLAEGSPYVQKSLSARMLPSTEDRIRPVHEGNSLPAYLIRFMTSTMMPQSRNAVCETLFILCNKDANMFTQQVGYGNAIGFLVNKGIPMDPPQDHDELHDINPITGQFTSSEKQGPDLKDMTDEEKEREAEKLFVLFERLKKTGIIDVENPIAKAMQEGKLEEIKSDSDSE
ncbi:guanine nucleotide exchange factor [Gilbertella persicaria]|uniref:guanine nucleotide exchange factor n=1 Tax=Gilbertella persicaria TaxID=101096 RepID=UPI002220C19C|nr:guanine nucleotide exchange factor [Gilbertella persicaria]KAI8091159.1 guanine nucleotide exchange factor [Gilbertella persicaria]